MTSVALALIGLATPRVDREAVVGDTVERFEDLRASAGPAAARRWLWRETARVLRDAAGHRLAARSTPSGPRNPGKAPLMSSVWQDVRYAVRWFGRSPGFTAVAVITLALGIGANTAMFAVVNAVLLKPLPFADADRLMLVHLLMAPPESGQRAETVWSYPKYRTFTEVQQAFEDTALFSNRIHTLAGDGDPERVRAETITDRYLPVLGLAPALGRSFTFEEANQAGASPVALIGHGLWTRRYGADRAILHRRLDLGGVSYAIVGVLPRGFRGLTGQADLWTPVAVSDAWALNEAMGHDFMMVARRKPGVSDEAAIAAVETHGAQIDAAHRGGPQPGQPWGATAASLEASRADRDVRQTSLIVFAAVGVVLLMACVNLTNLLVARAVARSREVAVRLALGAGLGRIARQFALEGLLLSGVGAAAGLLVASGLLAVAAALLPDAEVFFRSAVAPGTRRIAGAAGLTRIGADLIDLDTATLLFTAGLAIVTAALVSILPAWQASRYRPAHTLKLAGGPVTPRGAQGFGPRAVLVAGEIALAMVLLVGAGLLLKSAWHLQRTALGVDPSHVLTVGIDLPSASYSPERGRTMQTALLERIGALPGVEAVGLGNCLPASGGCNATSMRFLAHPQSPAASIGVHWASPEFFDVMRIRQLAGRMFAPTDRFGQPKVALVNEAAARAFWPHATPIGQRVAVGQGGFGDGAEIIGIVADVRYRSIETAATPAIYLPVAQSYRASQRLFLRSGVAPASLAAAVRRAVHALDPNLPLSSVKTMDESVGDAMWRTRVAGWLLSAFAGLALLLTSIGVFGVMAQTVAQRTPEFGLRMALGAQRGDVLALVLRRALIVTVCGLAIGIVAAVAVTRVLTTLLYDVTPTDPVTLTVVAVALGVVSLTAAYVPARRAVRVDPTVALKSH